MSLRTCNDNTETAWKQTLFRIELRLVDPRDHGGPRGLRQLKLYRSLSDPRRDIKPAR